jgi:hypothetical protein
VNGVREVYRDYDRPVSPMAGIMFMATIKMSTLSHTTISMFSELYDVDVDRESGCLPGPVSQGNVYEQMQSYVYNVNDNLSYLVSHVIHSMLEYNIVKH